MWARDCLALQSEATKQSHREWNTPTVLLRRRQALPTCGNPARPGWSALCLGCDWCGPIDQAAGHTRDTSHPTVYPAPDGLRVNHP
jgi:hypothetical protein